MGDAISTLLFQPPPASRLKTSKLVWLDTASGERIPVTFISTPGAKQTILYSHANAEDLGNIYPWCKFLVRSLRVNLLAYDYTGYGLSSGKFCRFCSRKQMACIQYSPHTCLYPFRRSIRRKLLFRHLCCI